MDISEMHKPLFEEIRKLFNNSKDVCHDFSHIVRVYNLTRKINEQEQADWDILGAAALLHDIHQILSQETGKHIDGKQSLPKAKEILIQSNFPGEKIDKVLHCIEYHDHYKFGKGGNPANSKEAFILQDADNLDAIGAIGVARCFLYGGLHCRPLYNDKILEKEAYDSEVIGESCLQHFYDKLFKLKENMNTTTAKKMAEDRHKFTEDFANKFKEEWI